MKKTPVVVLVVAALACLSSTAAHAQNVSVGGPQLGTVSPSPAFGKKGQAAILSDFNLRFDYYRYGATANIPAISYETIYFAPALMYFVVDNLAVGGSVSIAHTWPPSGEGSGTDVGIGPRVGYNINLGPYVSVFPRVGVSYDHFWDSGSSSPLSSSSSGYALDLNFDAYFLFHPVQHFFLGLGPVVYWDPIAKENGADVPKTLHVGIDFVIGGWVQLRRPTDRATNQ